MDPRYSNYPRMNPGSFGVRPPGAHFDFVGEAFNIVRSDFATWGVVSLLCLVATYAVSIPLSLLSNVVTYGSIIGGGSGFNPLGLLLTLVSSAVSYSVTYFLSVGIGMMGLRASRGETVTIGDLFRPFSRFVPVFAVSLVASFAVYLGLVLLIVPGIVATGLLALSGFAAYDQNLSAGDAIRWSVERSKPHLWAIFGLVFVASLVSGLGVILCCVGLLFTFPILGIVMGLTYGTFVPAPMAAGFSGGVDPNSNYPRGPVPAYPPAPSYPPVTSYPPAPASPPAEPLAPPDALDETPDETSGEALSPPPEGGFSAEPPRSSDHGENQPPQTG